MKKILTRILVQLRWPKTHTLYTVSLALNTLSKRLRYHILNNEYEYEEMSLCKKYLDSKDSLIEVGASIGFISLFCKKYLKIENVLLVEPNPVAISELVNNYALNNETPSLIEACLTNVDGTCHIHQSSDLWESSLLKEGNKLAVRGISLTTLLNESPFSPTAIIMDIEGAEESIDFTLLPKSVRKLIIEIHPGLVGYPKSFFVLNQLMNVGFNVQARMSNCYALTR
jgi:FkbM family methyltransferase